MMRIKNMNIRSLYVPAIILFVWELIGQVRMHIAPLLLWIGFDHNSMPDFSFLLPVSAIIPNFFNLIISGVILPYLYDTVWRSLVGFLFASVFGILIGIPIGLKRRNEELLLPTVDALRTIPPVALLPVIILLFGIGHSMKIVFIFIGSIWPVIINTAQAVKSVDPMYLKVSYNAGHSSRFTLRRVILPSALPGIFAGVKISLSISVILSIVSEMMVGNTGLGFFLNFAKRNFEYDTMFSTIIFIALLGWALNKIINAIDHKLLAWYYKSRESQMGYQK